MQKPTLISFNICPYVLRAVAFMYYKGLDFDIEYINLKQKPEWFLKISPFGKVPILRVGENVLFESNVILEYLDETNSPSIQPVDPLIKALNKGYYTLSTEFLVTLREIFFAADETVQNQSLQFKNTQNLLEKLENLLPAQGPFFNGEQIALIDFTFAPMLVQLQHLSKNINHDLFETCPKVKLYLDTITSLDSVKKSKVVDFDEIFQNSRGPYYQAISKNQYAEK